MRWNRKKTIALASSLIIHIAVLLLLFFVMIKSKMPEDDGGVLVHFGTIDAAHTHFEPQGALTAPQPTAQPAVTPPVQHEEEVITQEDEESVTLNAKKRQEQERRRREQDAAANLRKEAERKAEEDRRRAEAEKKQQEREISDRVAGAFSSTQAQQGSSGTAAQGEGLQGNPFGNADKGEKMGQGGFGSFNLSGRSLGEGGLPRPSYTIQEEGRIVINITVNPAGNVIGADVGRGTNIDNASMRKSAIEAAKRARFNRIQGANNQRGTITYIYSLK